MIRRQLLQGLALLLPAGWAGWVAADDGSCRRLEFLHTHTGQRHCSCYFRDGAFDEAAVAALDRFLGDHRNGEMLALDRRLYELLHELAVAAGLPPRYELISAYRSPETNAMLAARGGVSTNSLHMAGQAIDVRLQGLPVGALARLARERALGGVGLYRRPDFVHLDTGRVRHWEG